MKMITYTKLIHQGSRSLFFHFLECDRIIKFTNHRVFNVKVKFRFFCILSMTRKAKCNEITSVSCVLIRFVVFNNITAIFEYCTTFITFISSHSKYLLFSLFSKIVFQSVCIVRNTIYFILLVLKSLKSHRECHLGLFLNNTVNRIFHFHLTVNILNSPY